MWTFGDDDSVSLYARAEAGTVTLEQIREAETRAQLNELYVRNGTVLVTSEEPARYLMAFKVSKPGGAAYQVHFAAEPGKRAAKDMVITGQQLAAMQTVGMEGVKHMLFGLVGGTFTHTESGMKLRVRRTSTWAGTETVAEVVVVQFERSEPSEVSPEQTGSIDSFMKVATGEAVPEAPAPSPPEQIDLSGFPAIVELLEASGLVKGAASTVTVAEEFMSAVFLNEVTGRGSVIRAAKRLDLLLQGKTTLRGGAGWRELRQAGLLAELGAATAGSMVRSQHFIQQPTMEETNKRPRAEEPQEAVSADSGSDSRSSEPEGSDSDLSDIDSDSDGPRKQRPKAKSAALPAPKKAATARPVKTPTPKTDLAAFVPRDGSLSALATARILFEESSVRGAAGCDELPDATSTAGREWRYEQRANDALGDLLQVIGRALVPTKPPKDEVELQQAAEEIYRAVRKAARSSGGGGGGGGPRGGGGDHGAGIGLGRSGDRSEEADLDRKPDPPMEAKVANAAVRAGTAAQLAAGIDNIKAAWHAAAEDPVQAMRNVSDPILRDELARAMVSNGKVYAPGEDLLRRRHLMPAVHEMRGKMLEPVIDALLECVDPDCAGVMHMSRETAQPLAEAALAGNFSWPAFSKASKAMLQDAAEPTGTVGEMAQTFVLIEAAWAAVLDGVYGVVKDKGLACLTKQLGATAKLQSKKLLPEQREVHQRKLLRWVSFVLDKYAEDTRAFRGGGLQRPSVAAAMGAFTDVYVHVQGTATMASELLKEWMPAQAQQKTQRGKKPPGSAGAKGDEQPVPEGAVAAAAKKKKTRRGKGGGKAAAAAESDGDAADEEVAPPTKKGGAGAPRWKDKPKLEKEAYQAAISSFRETFPEHCNWHMFSTCSRSDSECKFKHEVPPAFADWANKVGK